MKLLTVACLITLASSLTNCRGTNTDDVETQAHREFYQLKIYTFSGEQQQEVTEQYIKKALLPTLKQMDIGPVGVFKNRISENDSSKRIFILLPFSSLVQFEQLEKSLNQDSNYLFAGSDYLNAPYDAPPYARIESILLRAFENMPKMKPAPLTNPRADRIYELRSYESPTERIFENKVDMFNGGGEIALFDQLKFNAVFYGEVISGPKMPNLMYMTAHADSASRAINWKNFVDSPEWKAMSSSEKYQNNISHIDITFLYPTGYSDY